MAVKLRLKRFGRTHQPFYRLAAMDSRSPRDGVAIEELGTYDPKAKDESQAINFNTDRVSYWLSVGAQPSETVRSLLRKVGVETGTLEKSRGRKPAKA